MSMSGVGEALFVPPSDTNNIGRPCHTGNKIILTSPGLYRQNTGTTGLLASKIIFEIVPRQPPFAYARVPLGGKTGQPEGPVRPGSRAAGQPEGPVRRYLLTSR